MLASTEGTHRSQHDKYHMLLEKGCWIGGAARAISHCASVPLLAQHPIQSKCTVRSFEPILLLMFVIAVPSDLIEKCVDG